MFPVERVLEETHDVVADGVFRGEAFGPGEDGACAQGGLLDGEGEG